MRFGAMFIGGVAAILLLKLIASLVFPFVALVIGLIGTVIKLVLIGAAVYFVYTLLRNRKRESAV